MKFKNILVRYGMGFLILWILGTIIPVILLDPSTALLFNLLAIIFNIIGYLIFWLISIVWVDFGAYPYTQEIIVFLILTFGQIITCILYKFLLKKLFKIRW